MDKQYQTLNLLLEDNLAIIEINRPKYLNALNPQVYEELSQALLFLKDQESIKAVIITGSGDKAFVAGADIAEMEKMTAYEARQFAIRGKDVGQTISAMEIPVIAAVNGYALGGGCELAMSCDLVIATENSIFGQPEIKLGIIPGNGGTQRLPRLVGLQKAKELVLLGEQIDAHEALRIGLINKVVASQEEMMVEAKKWASKIISKSKIILGLAKNALNNGLDVDLKSGLDIEISNFAQCFATADKKEGISAFLEKRKPVFKDC